MSPDRAVDVALAEFDAVRTLIGSRFEMQVTLLVAALTAIGVLGGFALGDKGNPQLLVLIPVLASSMSLLYSEQARRIALMGDYIKKTLWPCLKSLTGVEVPSWEAHWGAQRGNNAKLLLAIGDLPPVVLLAGVSLLCLIQLDPWEAAKTYGLIVVWSLGAILTLLSAAPIGAAALSRLEARKQQRSETT